MTELETKQAARIADLETALRSMAQIAHDAIGEQSRFLADSLDYGMRVILETAGLEPLSGVRTVCLGNPCDGTQCPPCAAVRSQNAGDVAPTAPPPIGDCTKPPLPGGWNCSLHANHSGPCSELPF